MIFRQNNHVDMDAYKVALQALLDATVALNVTEHIYSLIIIYYIFLLRYGGRYGGRYGRGCSGNWH